jgi:predicted RNase H-like HicB family nuclease
MKIKVIIHEAAEGGYWAEVPAFPGCFSQGEIREESWPTSGRPLPAT